MSRIDAARAGRTTYAGNPCKQGHDGERYVSDGKCIHCARERARATQAHIRQLREEARTNEEAGS